MTEAAVLLTVSALVFGGPPVAWWLFWCRAPFVEGTYRCDRKAGHSGAHMYGHYRWFTCVGCKIPTFNRTRVCTECEQGPA